MRREPAGCRPTVSTEAIPISATSPPVTIGLPVFNGERHLTHALESLLAQTYADLSLVIFDNGSSDATEEICRDYAEKDDRITYRRFSVNRGAARNFSELVDATDSPFFKWASADDAVAPEFLERCLDRMRDEPPDVSLVYPRTMLMDQEGREVRPYEDRVHLPQARPSDRVDALLRNLMMCNAAFGVHRRDVLRQTRRIAPYPSSDIPLLVEIAMRGRVLEIPDRLFYRRLPTSVQGRSLTERQSWFDPGRRVPRLPVDWRIRFETEQAIWRSNVVPVAERARAARMHLTVLVGEQYAKAPVPVRSTVRKLRGKEPLNPMVRGG